MLIGLRGPNNAQFEKFQKKGQKMLIWKKVADEMKQNHYNFGANQCDEKWRPLLCHFRQVRDSSKRSGSGGIKWQYYELMRDALSPSARLFLLQNVKLNNRFKLFFTTIFLVI